MSGSLGVQGVRGDNKNSLTPALSHPMGEGETLFTPQIWKIIDSIQRCAALRKGAGRIRIARNA